MKQRTIILVIFSVMVVPFLHPAAGGEKASTREKKSSNRFEARALEYPNRAAWQKVDEVIR